MTFAWIFVLAFSLVLLSAAAGFMLFVRFITSESEADDAMRFDPFGKRPPSPWYFNWMVWLRNRPRLLTYRRDQRGRFRKSRR